MTNLTRRQILQGGAVLPGAVAIGLLNNRWAFAQGADFADDVEVLNYALTLEYLEAEFYKQGNSRNLVSGKEAAYLNRIGADEAAHVTALQDTIKKLGGTPVAAPAVDFKDSFDSREKYLTVSHTFENTGVSAYLGAAGFIKSKQILQAAAGIFGVEARHAAIVGQLLGLDAEGGVYMGATETPKTKAEVLNAVAPFLASGSNATPSSDGSNSGGGGTQKPRAATPTPRPRATAAPTPAPTGPVPSVLPSPIPSP